MLNNLKIHYSNTNSKLLFVLSATTYLFMVQARGIMLRENVKTIGHMIRLYTNKNTTLNGTGKNISYLVFKRPFFWENKKTQPTKKNPNTSPPPPNH